tara:strand:+ start:295 stop:918 length:624 start_codon:yes stop_codon:yes gene_type:complete
MKKSLDLAKPARMLIIACGALAREIQALRRSYGWEHIDLKCLDADLHNRPKLIAGKLRQKIALYKDQYEKIFVAYADCGSGGEIDKVLEEHCLERLPGAHCYSFYAGKNQFIKLSQQEPGTFYLTDFLVENFDRIVIRGLKIDRYPELLQQYFANYRRVVYLSQTRQSRLLLEARRAAQTLGLRFEHNHCGYGDLESCLQVQVLKFG